MKNLRFGFAVFALALACGLFCLGALGAESESGPADAGPHSIASGGSSADGGATRAGHVEGNAVGVSALVAVIVPLLLGALKGWLPIKWRKWLPLAAPILGELITQIFTALPNGGGAVAGLAGVGVREAVKKKTLGGAPSGTGGAPVLPMLLICTGVFLSGCAALDKAASAVTVPKISSVTNTVTQVVTNYVPVPVRVPGETVTVTNVVREVVTNLVERVETVTNFVARAEIADSLQAAQRTSNVVGVFNPGAGAIGSGVLGVVAAGLGFLVRRRNQQNASLETQIKSLIVGVEQGAAAIPNGGKVKEIIARVSKEFGVSDALHESVQAALPKPVGKVGT